MTSSTPKPILKIILEWSNGKPAWQCDALRRIVIAGTLTDADMEDVVQLCKKEHGFPNIALNAEPLAEDDLPAIPEDDESVSLVSISDVVGVNQLAPSQSLPFATDGITIIYGDNGAGKSGYARVLKRACRARHAGEIMPDAFQPAPGAKATATITLSRAGAPDPVAWVDEGRPHPVLSAINVFDRECGSVHVREPNEVTFRPFGLDIPDELAGACQRLKASLEAEQGRLERSRHATFLKPTWKDGTAVGRLLSSLRHDAAIEPLQQLAAVSAPERDRHARLSQDLAGDPQRAAEEQTLFASQLGQLADALDRLDQETADTPLQALCRLAHDAATKRTAARHAASSAFQASSIKGVGGDTWRVLWDAARHFAEHVSHIGEPFPPVSEQAFCVLCHQPLTSEALGRLADFDAFVRADTERQAADAEQALQRARNTYDAGTVHAQTYGATRRQVAIIDHALGHAVLRFLAAARLRRYRCTRSLTGDSATVALPAPAPNPAASLRQLQAKRRAYVAELRQAAHHDTRKILEQERDELTDRIALSGLLDIATDEIARLADIERLKRCISSTATNAITRLGNAIADDAVTPRMRDRFQDEIVKLAANRVRVEINRAGGRYGSPHYQVRFFGNPAVRVLNVLSEGEQTCVALAAFLTELATASHRSALVFDDPISSLDHRWRRKVAERLVEEADHRQIIVFTHDLVFLNDVKDHAESRGKSLKLVTLSRSPAGAGTVALGLPWTAASVKDRIDRLEKEVRIAKALYEQNDDAA